MTRDSILDRYREPADKGRTDRSSNATRAAARDADRAANAARAATRDADRNGLRREDDLRRRTEERQRAARASNARRDQTSTESAQLAERTRARDASRAAERRTFANTRVIERKNIANETARQRLAAVDRLTPKQSQRVIERSVATARGVDRSVRASLQASFGAFGYGGYGSFAGNRNFGGGLGGWYGDFSNPTVRGNWFTNCYWPSWNSWYFSSGLWCPFGSRNGFGWGGFGGGGFGWGGGFGGGFGFGFGNRGRNFNSCYQPFWNTWSLYQPFASWYCPRPVFYTPLWIDNGPNVVVIEAPREEEEWIEEAPVGEGWVDQGAAPVNVSGSGAVVGGATLTSDTPLSEELSRAASHYLTVGDRAFREGRYGDAVHFYAKAVEFSPDDGVLFLILSDALFATGDYHYGAYALRRALELDPTLTESVVDKHSFYTDELEFDRQLAVLEEYLEDHFLDDDARLLLAANYLFGGRPAAAVDLLSSAFSKNVADSQAGGLILSTARVIQFGEVPAETVPAESGK